MLVRKRAHAFWGVGEIMKTKRYFWAARVVTGVLVAVGLVGWLEREALLMAAADPWVVAGRLTHADAIVVLGGNARTRPPVAADLFRRGLADKVLISRSDYEPNRAALLEFGIPASAIEGFGSANKNTREEAVALREWAERNGASVFVIPSEPFMTRRVRWIFCREFSGRLAKIEVQPFYSPHYLQEAWWRTEEGSLAFKSEIVKYLYYRWKY
jgi:hypothetical protein